MQRITPVILVASLFLAAPAGAQEKWTHFGIRPLAMGNAYVAVADDFNALFYNPAGLARLKEWDGEFFNPAVEIGLNTVSFLKNVFTLVGSKAAGTSEVLDMLEGQVGKRHRMAATMTPHFIAPGWGFGIGTELGMNLTAHADIDIDMDLGPRVIAPVAYAMNLLEDKVSVGFALKGIFAMGLDEGLNIETIAVLGSSDGSQDLGELLHAGAGVGADVGFLFTPIKPMAPTLGVSVTDVAGSSFRKLELGETGAATPGVRLPSVNTGFSIIPYSESGQYIRVAVDAHSINQPLHFSHQFHMGVEWGLYSLIKMQTGLMGGDITAGLQFDVGVLNLRIATYTVSHGPVVGLHEDLTERRVAAQIKLLI